MLASIPASMVNQKPADLGIPNRFKLSSSRFSSLIRMQSAPLSNSPTTVACPACGLEAEIFREGRSSTIAQPAHPELCKLKAPEDVCLCPRIEVARNAGHALPRTSGYQLIKVELGRYGETIARNISTLHLSE
jgi:hypothetical protein